jgi:hypothetical protein
MRKLEWDFSNLFFCNGISPSGESCSGIDPIIPFLFDVIDWRRVVMLMKYCSHAFSGLIALIPY